MADLESQLALARATAERLAEKEALVAAEVLLRRREYRDVVTGGEDVIVAALAARDQALANAQTQLDYMRRDLSMLTAAGAQMAVALEQRNREYDTVRDRLVAARNHHTRAAGNFASHAAQAAAPVEAATVEAGPDMTAELAVRAAELNALQQRYDELRAALDQAIAERDELHGQLTAHQASVEELNGKVTEGQRALETVAAEKDDLLHKLSARAAIMDTVLAKISDFDVQLRGLVAARTQVENHDDAPAVTDAATQEEEGETHAS
jgi:chromosome segregation ATPase